MSENNYKPAIKAIQEARQIKKGLSNLFFQILADNPKVIVNAWDNIKDNERAAR